MTLFATLLPQRLAIHASASLVAAITDWAEAIDTRVLHHQITTGTSWDGSPMEDWWLQLVRQTITVEQESRILPYYGTIQDAYAYTISFTTQEILLHGHNGVTQHEITFREPWSQLGHTHGTTSVLFTIEGKAFRRLQRWSAWERQEALRGRYTYRFVPTTIGCLISVHDNETHTQYDLSPCLL